MPCMNWPPTSTGLHFRTLHNSLGGSPFFTPFSMSVSSCHSLSSIKSMVRILPPMRGRASRTNTSCRRSDSSRAQAKPAIPAPIMMTRGGRGALLDKVEEGATCTFVAVGAEIADAGGGIFLFLNLDLDFCCVAVAYIRIPILLSSLLYFLSGKARRLRSLAIPLMKSSEPERALNRFDRRVGGSAVLALNFRKAQSPSSALTPCVDGRAMKRDGGLRCRVVRIGSVGSSMVDVMRCYADRYSSDIDSAPRFGGKKSAK